MTPSRDDAWRLLTEWTSGENLRNALASLPQDGTLVLADGHYSGPIDINSDGVLTVGENAEIRGEIKTKSITVYGKVHGNITVGERCELKSKCVLQGDLKAARLVIEEGATFIGKSEVTTGAYSAKAAQRPEVVRSSEPIKAAFGRA